MFISYNWSIKDQVDILENKLKSNNLKVWRDIRNLEKSDNPLTSQLSEAIKKSKLVICCITKEYCRSHNCNLEIEWANTLKKPLIVLMIDKLDLSESIQVTDRNYASGVPFIIK